ncbi:hypothetical protein [Bilophila wadsworthia]|uniref:hypothetical protein n=1 Tax=Bilophila wadsworthia TaxID=35833 RepID=UPI003AB150EF
MANVNSAAVNNNGNKKAPEAPQLTLSHPGEATAPAVPPKPGTPIPVGHSDTLVRIDN